MSDRLTLSGIRESAMNPPAGTAAGYQDLLWDQMVQANTDAYNAYMQSLRDTANRAMERSGWYNVGRMMIPQDAGDVALAAAMGPGLGRLPRAVLAALGGMTTQPGDAAGTMLSLPQWMRAIRGELTPMAREVANEALSSYTPAARRLYGADAAPLRRPGAYTGDEVNQAFDDVALPTLRETGWLAMPRPERDMADMMHGATRDRFVWPSGNLMSSLLDGQPSRPLSERLRDSLLFAAEPDIAQTQLAYNSRMPYRGAFVAGNAPERHSIFINPTQSQSAMDDSLHHEIQHALQAVTRRAGGSNTQRVAQENPDLYERYFQGFVNMNPDAAVTDVAESARRGMYRRVPGEWEAVLGANYSTLDPNFMRRNPFESMLGLHPDFNLRGTQR